ncbi:TPA: head decoration protein [Escherichia coli]|nr:head decoration protein [Escherichia coli]
MTGYNGIIARLQQAASDPMVDGILLDMDTPGGMVAGAFDCADSRKLVAWDGTTDGAAVGILAVAADQTSTTLTFYKSGTFRYEDVLWPEAASDETKKRTAFAGTAISIV